MPVDQILEAQLIERELINVEFIEKELISVTLYTLDLIQGRRELAQMNDVTLTSPSNDEVLVYENGYWVNKTVSVIIDTYAVHNEVPTPSPPVLTSEKYTTAYDFRSETLEVFLNGVKLGSSDITIYPDNQFSISIDTIISDLVTVNYIKK